MVTPAQRPRTAQPAPAGQVFLVDDEPSVRRAFTRLLRTAGFSVSSFGTAEEFLAAAPHKTRGCVVADLRMPGLSGLELQDRVAERGLDLPIVFVSGRADLGSGIQAMKGGAVDFLEKPVSDRDLIDAIRRALAEGERRRSEREERELLEARLSKLTPREREVCSLIVVGRLNKQVGAELGACEKTIKVHRARVMEKMKAGSLAELVRMSYKLGLLVASTAPAEFPRRVAVKKGIPLSSLVAVLGLVALPVAAQTKVPAPIKEADVSTVTATVEAIDSTSRLVTLRGDKGKLTTGRVPDSVDAPGKK